VVSLCRHRLTGDIDEIYALFDRPADAPPSPYDVQVSFPTISINEHRANAAAVSEYTPSMEWCAVCCGSHCTTKCPCLNGICFACGSKAGHPSKSCPNPVLVMSFVFIVICHVLTPHAQCTTVYPHSCAKCRLPRFEIDGIAVHGKDYGALCPSQRLADEVKILLLTGKAAGSHFGPGSYQDRLKWAMQGMLLLSLVLLSDTCTGNVPNLISVLAM
jgi:hypothetical protein